jgi:hypothetical protein
VAWPSQSDQIALVSEREVAKLLRAVGFALSVETQFVPPWSNVRVPWPGRDRPYDAHRLCRPIDETALVAQAESYATLESESLGVSGRPTSCCACLSRSSS